MTAVDPVMPDAYCDPSTGRIFLNGRKYEQLPLIRDAPVNARPLVLVSVHDLSVYVARTRILQEVIDLADERDDDEALDAILAQPKATAKTDEPPAAAEIPVCGMCRRERTLEDAYDYNPIQVVTGKPLGWYSGEDGEVCPGCMTKVLRGPQ